MESSKQKVLPVNPRSKANFISYLCFWWVFPIFFKGRKQELDTSDLYQPLKDHKSDMLGDALSKAWEDEKYNKESKGKTPNLLRATLRVFGWKIMSYGLMLAALEFFLKVSQPIFIGGLIRYYSGKTSDINEAYMYAGGIVLCSALTVLFMHPYMLSNLHVGMQLRVAVCSMIYRKALKLSKNALGETTAGQVVNLLSNDVGRLDLSVLFIHYLWIGPLECIVITYLMYREIGISAVFGVLFLLLFIPLQAWLGKKTSELRLKTALRTDERVRLMNEIIQGIQVIKMYAWEKPFEIVVAYARKKEINVIRYVSYIRGILLSFIMFTTRVSVFISLVAFALLGNVVTAEKAFVITAFYNILRQTMTIFFPQGIGQLAETLVSFQRIQKYMLYDETELADKSNSESVEKSEKKPETFDEKIKYPGSLDDVKPSSHLSEPGIVVTSVVAKWNAAIVENTLDDVNLRIQPGTVVAIIGPVGGGKSSLIQAILGELPINSGTMKINGVVSYASQEPWLFSGTVRQNILFGQPMDRDRYKEVVKRCALERDFTLFAYGDKTIVGERGQSLSGGQKARISLARAIYRKASIYLLDDPLSAVDTHVGRHLFDQCIKGFLKGKIVVLVTHQLQYLQSVDQLVIFEGGKIKAVGSYESLQQSGLDFAKLLASSTNIDEEEETKGKSRSFQRQNSENSISSMEETQDNPMEVAETRAKGAIGLSMYRAYFSAAGGSLVFISLAFFYITAQVLASGGDYFITYWANKEETAAGILKASQNDTFDGFVPIEVKDGLFERIFKALDIETDRYLDIYIFSGIIIGTVLITLCRTFLFFNVAMRASKNLHNKMFHGIARASMYFFNTNPSGRILNRFSKDMGQVDEILPGVMVDVIQIFLSLAGIIVVVAVVNYWFLIPTVVIGILFYFMRNFYLQSSRSIKRMEATTRSPIYSHLSASLTGLSTIRAFNAQKILVQEFDNHQDLHSSSYYLFIATSRSFGFWLDVVCVVYIAIVTLSFFMMGDDYGGNVGLAITQAMGMTGMVQWGMRQSAELETTMTAVERVVEYQTVDTEPNLESTEDKKPPKEWPVEGGVKFNKVSMRYFPDQQSETILKDLTFEVAPGEKIGIVGRTGAGKSSLINALFRLSYNDGQIIIDDRDTQEMGLYDLRAKISIIPQEPVLFSGTMRLNLDPFDEYPDEKLWKALEEVKLKQAISDLPSGLQSKISEGGSNFSVGQRQLVCLARAILRENKILVMDEATANVDPQTDALIQITIRDKFKNCTVLTIAHRLNTVMDCDKILVMDAGRVVEYDSPHILLGDKTGRQILRGLAKETGRANLELLERIAEETYMKKKSE